MEKSSTIKVLGSMDIGFEEYLSAKEKKFINDVHYHFLQEWYYVMETKRWHLQRRDTRTSTRSD